jgi:hypothetical protein
LCIFIAGPGGVTTCGTDTFGGQPLKARHCASTRIILAGVGIGAQADYMADALVANCYQPAMLPASSGADLPLEVMHSDSARARQRQVSWNNQR